MAASEDLSRFSTMAELDAYEADHPTSDPILRQARQEKRDEIEAEYNRIAANKRAAAEKEKDKDDNNKNDNSNSGDEEQDDDVLNNLKDFGGNGDNGNGNHNGGGGQRSGRRQISGVKRSFEESHQVGGGSAADIVRMANLKFTNNEIGHKEYKELLKMARDFKVVDGGLDKKKKKKRKKNKDSSIVCFINLWFFIFIFLFLLFFFVFLHLSKMWFEVYPQTLLLFRDICFYVLWHVSLHYFIFLFFT